MEHLPPPIASEPAFRPVPPPAGSPDAERKVGAPAAKTAAPVRALDFLDPARRSRTVPLAHPFRLDGREVRSVTVRSPLTAEVGAWREDNVAGRADSFDLYAVMTGLPADVLRGLDGDDGGEVVAAAYDFLPRWLKPEDGSAAT